MVSRLVLCPEFVPLQYKRQFSASEDSGADYKFSQDQSRLGISAVHLDTIDVYGMAVGTLTTVADYLMVFLHWWALLRDHCDFEDSDFDHPLR